MKAVLVTLALCVAYVACENCTTRVDCHNEICSDAGWALECTFGECSCDKVLSNGQRPEGIHCTVYTDCTNVHCTFPGSTPHCIDNRVCRCLFT